MILYIIKNPVFNTREEINIKCSQEVLRLHQTKLNIFVCD